MASYIHCYFYSIFLFQTITLFSNKKKTKKINAENGQTKSCINVSGTFYCIFWPNGHMSVLPGTRYAYSGHSALTESHKNVLCMHVDRLSSYDGMTNDDDDGRD